MAADNTFSYSVNGGEPFKIKLEGDRYNTGKPKWSLVDWDAFEDMVAVLEYGTKKYAAFNWKRGLKITEIMESMQRHINAIMRGEDIDKESGLSHIGHLQCNAMFLGYMIKYRKDMDDRYIDHNKPENNNIENDKIN